MRAMSAENVGIPDADYTLQAVYVYQTSITQTLRDSVRTEVLRNRRKGISRPRRNSLRFTDVKKKKKKEAEIRNESLTFLLSFVRRKHPSCEVVGGSAGRHFIFTERSETRRSDNLLVSAVQKKTRKTTFIRRVESIYHRS